MSGWTLSVSDLNEYVRKSLAGDPMLRDVRLRGEISGFKLHVSGHWYFTLKDEESRINCVIFRQNNLKIGFRPADGMRVVLHGAAGLYTASGSFQFYADSMEKDGMGDLFLRYEELKRKLFKEGLFDPAAKKPLPLLPRRVGVVTSRTGAVIHDIATVSRRRNPAVQIILRPAQVQGESAAADIARGIEDMTIFGNADVLIVGRGGGSLEDLWAFNEEIVVRAIAACPIPVISAVGHEVDTTLSDLAADVRAATPSAAAELAVPQREVLLSTVEEMTKRLCQGGAHQLLRMKERLAWQEKRLTACHPAVKLQSARQKNDLLSARMQQLTEKMLLNYRSALSSMTGKLEVLGPKKALERGYAVVLHNGKAVTSVEEMPDEAELILRNGRVRVKTLEKKEGDPFGSQKENA